MAKDYSKDYDERLLEGKSETKYEEDPRTEQEPDSDMYYPLPNTVKSRSLKWAVISLVAGILSLVLCPVYYVGMIFVALTCLCTAVSRRNLGFFDKYSTTGLILGIVGLVCNIFSMAIDVLGLLR